MSHASRTVLSPELGDSERSYVFSIAMKYMKDEEAAADVAQDALLLAHQHRKSFRGDSRYSTWLYRIAATTALMHLRKHKRKNREVLAQGRAGEVTFPEDRPAHDPSPEERAANSEAVGRVRDRLAQMGSKYEEIFWMRYLEGYTESEIARRLELNLSTVKTRAHRARLAARESVSAA